MVAAAEVGRIVLCRWLVTATTVVLGVSLVAVVVAAVVVEARSPLAAMRIPALVVRVPLPWSSSTTGRSAMSDVDYELLYKRIDLLERAVLDLDSRLRTQDRRLDCMDEEADEARRG